MQHRALLETNLDLLIKDLRFKKTIHDFTDHEFDLFVKDYNNPNWRFSMSPQIPESWYRKYIQNPRSKWRPYIDIPLIDQNDDGSWPDNNIDLERVIVIPYSYHDELLSGPRTAVTKPNGGYVGYEYVISTKPRIELFVYSDGTMAIPDGMDGKHPMEMVFSSLQDFIEYLREEMAQGKYPEHLSS